MEISSSQIHCRFCLGRKKKVRKMAANSSQEFIHQQVLQLFPELAKIQYEAYYKEYMIESAEDLESAVEEFQSTDALGFWFDIRLVNPDAPPPRKAPTPVQKVTAPPIAAPVPAKAPVPVPAARAAPVAPRPTRRAPPPAAPAPPNPYQQQQATSNAAYAPHKHLGQMTPDQRVLHKLVWGLSGGAWMRTADLKKKLPGKKKPNLQKITTLMNQGIDFGYFLLENAHYALGPVPIPFDSFIVNK